jgi:hypothetical protein
MLHEGKAKELLKRIIKHAQLDRSIFVVVRDEDGEKMNDTNKVDEIIDCIFSVDVCEVYFVDRIRRVNKGWIVVVLEYNTPPDEIISDYLLNDYINELVKVGELAL